MVLESSGSSVTRPAYGAEMLVEPLEDHALAQRPRADLEASRSNMSITASATSAPGTSWWARRRDARQVGPLRGVMSSASGSTRPGRPSAARGVRTDRPRRRGATDPGQRPEGLGGRDRRGRLARRAVRPGDRGDLGPDPLAQRLDLVFVRQVVGRQSRVNRRPRAATDRDVGLLVGAAAISSDPPPMSNTASRPDDHPNQRRTARNVSRASSSPRQDRGPTPVSSATRSSTLSPLPASRTAEVANAEHQRALVLRQLDGFADER